MVELPPGWSASKPNRAPGCHFEKQPVLDIFVQATRPHNHRTVSNRLGNVADQIEKWEGAGPYRISLPASLPFPVSLMAPIFARFPAIKAGISRSRWDALLREAEHRLSLPVRRITHVLDWSHLSMRLRHIEQAWGASGICKIRMSICKALRSMCPDFGISSGAGMTKSQTKP